MTASLLRNAIRIPLLLAASALALVAQGVLADPPARVGRLSYVAGVVSFSPAGDDQWAQALRNRPVIAGDRVWSDRDGRVEIAFGSGAVRAGATTSLGVVNIDAGLAQFELTQGAIDLRVRRLARGEVVEIDTPNLAFQVTQPGRYRIEVDPRDDATLVLVRDGAADVFGERASYVVERGQGYRFFGTDLADPQYVRARGIDALDRFAQERDARVGRVQSARYVSPNVVGYEDLDQYGTWRVAGDYGNVWFPRDVPGDWAPYRDGHWSWIDPWGWTWVDDSPWGFAPFHYGRWAHVDNRWGWVPGPVNVQPVYAPALVAFIGGATLAISASSGPTVGWFPLAPREVYRPAYAVSRDYYRNVNVSNTVINTTIINNTYVNNFNAAPPPRDVAYANLRVANAITAVPPSTLAESRPVARAAVRLPARTVDVAQVTAAAQVAPSRTAFVGAAPAARGRPPEQAREPAVVAKTAPPAPPVPIAQKLPLLERTPGQPLARTDVPASRGTPAPGPARNVKVVETQGPAARQAPPAATTAAPVAPPAPGATADRGRSDAARPSPSAPPSPERGRANATGDAAPGRPAPPRPAPGQEARPPAAPAAAPPPVTSPAPPRSERGPGTSRGNAPAAPAERGPARPDPEARPAPQGRTDAPNGQPTPRAPRAEPVPPPAARPDAAPPPAPRANPPAASPPPAPPRDVQRERPQPESRPAPPPAAPAANAPPPRAPAAAPTPERPAAPPKAAEPPRPAPRPAESRPTESARPVPPARSQAPAPAPAPTPAPPAATRGAPPAAPAAAAPPPAPQRDDERGPDANRGKGRDKKE